MSQRGMSESPNLSNNVHASIAERLECTRSGENPNDRKKLGSCLKKSTAKRI